MACDPLPNSFSQLILFLSPLIPKEHPSFINNSNLNILFDESNLFFCQMLTIYF